MALLSAAGAGEAQRGNGDLFSQRSDMHQK